MNHASRPCSLQLPPLVSGLFVSEKVLCHLDVTEVSGEISNDLHVAQPLSLNRQPVYLFTLASKGISGKSSEKVGGFLKLHKHVWWKVVGKGIFFFHAELADGESIYVSTSQVGTSVCEG